MKEENEFSYPKKAGAIFMNSLAQKYFPKSTTRSAVSQLHRWIAQCKPLQEKLRELYYKPYQRVLTPRQHQAILDALGEP